METLQIKDIQSKPITVEILQPEYIKFNTRYKEILLNNVHTKEKILILNPNMDDLKLSFLVNNMVTSNKKILIIDTIEESNRLYIEFTPLFSSA